MPSKKQTFQLLFTFCFALPLLCLVSIAQAAQIEKLLEQAEKGSVKAQTELGLVYELGKGIQKDPQKGAFWYRKAAEQGYARAQTNLGILYETGVGVSADFGEARIWYKKAADQEYARAQSYLGRLHELGRGTPKDMQKAAFWYGKAAEQGYARAQTNLGSLYKNGSGVELDYGKAVKWYQKAAVQKYARAQTYLGQMYEQGLGVDKDQQLAIKWYKDAAAQGYRKAIKYLKQLEEQLAEEQVKKKPQPSETKDLPASKEPEIATGVAQTEQPAVPYIQAANRGDTKAQNNLALLYLNGGQGFSQDEEKAMYWFHKAAALGNADAQNNLGLMYLNGQGVVIDYQQAAFWLTKAAEQGNIAAQNNLGLMFFSGQGVEQDYQQAAFWLLKAAKGGDAPAQNNLATMYADGLGVEKNMDRAIYWLRQAADQGDETARKNLTMFVLDLQDSAVAEQKSSADDANSMVYSLPAENEAMENPSSTSIQTDLQIPVLSGAREYFQKGNLYAKDGQFELAITEYKQAVALDPSNSNTYENLAISYAKTGKFNNAVETMQTAIQLNPDDAMKYATLGIIYHANMQLNDALEYYKLSLRINPGLSEIYYNMATIHIEQEQLEMAQKAAYLAQNLGYPGSSEIIADIKRNAPSLNDNLELGEVTFHLRQIVTSSEARAQEALGLLKKGRDFSLLAEKFSFPPFHLNGGYIGPYVPDELMPEIVEAVEPLPPFAYSPVIVTDSGSHIFQKFFIFNDLLASR